MNKILGLAAGAAFAIAALDAQAADAALRNDIAADYRERLAALFDHFHRNPELSGLEVETSKRLAAELRALGYEVTEGVGGTASSPSCATARARPCCCAPTWTACPSRRRAACRTRRPCGRSTSPASSSP